MSIPAAIVRDRTGLQTLVDSWKAGGATVGIVPTMGALHKGHLSLVDTMGRHADKTLVSIFVNPAQFGPNEDFDAYPRDEAGDLAALADTPADAVYIPDRRDMYPDGFDTAIRVGAIADRLEGASRPGHFDGVATIVAKLILTARADYAIFGEKDYQQLCVIRHMAADLNLPVKILGGTTVREDDGLASSSRNRYFDTESRPKAAGLNRALRDLTVDIRNGLDVAAACAKAEQSILSAGFASVDYVAVADAETLAPLTTPGARPGRVLAAARLHGVRLIDNLPL